MAWSTLKVRGVILASFAVREADRMYYAYTRELGRLTFFGRSARKGSAKLAPHLEGFSEIDLEVVRGKRSFTVIQADRVRRFRGIEGDAERRVLVGSSFLMMQRQLRDMDVDVVMYEGLLQWMGFLDVAERFGSTRKMFLLGSFLLRLLGWLGYEVVLDVCVGCRGGAPREGVRWHGPKGGLVCKGCFEEAPREWFAARVIDGDVVKFLRFARGAQWEDLMRVELRGDVVRAFCGVVHDLCVYHFPVRVDVPFWEGVV